MVTIQFSALSYTAAIDYIGEGADSFCWVIKLLKLRIIHYRFPSEEKGQGRLQSTVLFFDGK